MRILASNPDTIGDMVLRQPLYRALVAGGHELTLIVRKSVEPIAKLIVPEATTIVLPQEVYCPVDERWEAFVPLVRQAIEFRPDLLLIAPFQWTRFEERLAAELREPRNGLPGVKVAGMSGRLYAGDPYAGQARPSELRLDQTLAVDEDIREADKNALLADMLGCPVASVEPVLVPDDTSRAAAERILAERGLSPGEYWIACVTGTANVPIKAWPATQWAQVLRHWHERYGRRFLFVGLPAERSVVELTLAGMADAATSAAVWMEPDGDVTTLAALAAMSEGYVGHDTGPMHIAAAVGKPVLAIFGGGHKLRFAPRATPSIVLSVRVPCAGCGWACSFEEAHCVQALRPADVLRAIDDLEVGRIVGQDIRLLPLPIDVQDRMTLYAADLARDRLRLLSSAQRQLDLIDPSQIARLTVERNATAQTAEELAQKLSVVSAEVRRLNDVTQKLETQSSDLSKQLQDREQAVVELRRAIEEANQRTNIEAAARKSEVEPLRKEVEQLRHKLSAMEPAPVIVVPARPRRSWRELLVDVVCGKRHYEPKRVPPPMPTIRLVTIVRPGDKDEDICRTIDSAIAEGYPHLEYVLVSNGVPAALNHYTDRVTKIVEPTAEPFGATAEAIATGESDLVAWLDVGTAYEPGALHRAGEYFRDHSMAMAAVFEETSAKDGGWRFHHGWPRVDVDSLRHDGSVTSLPHVFFRRQPYGLIGPINPAKGEAAGWDLLIRFSRRFGIRRVRGHGVYRFAAPAVSELAHVHLGEAINDFNAGFGLAGRIRCRATAVGRELASLLRQWVVRDDWRWPSWVVPEGGVAAPAEPLQTATSPINHRRPDRLLFSSPDVTTGGPEIYRVYRDAAGDAAIACPSIASDRLLTLCTERQRRSGSSVVPSANVPAGEGISVAISPFQRFRGGPRWARIVAALPSPYWRLAGAKAAAETPTGRLRSMVGPELTGDSSVRALVVGCYDGRDMDDIKSTTKWILTGLETNTTAAAEAEAKGHRVFRCNPQDAFMTLPDGEVFDLIFLPSVLEHWDDPAWVLRRLQRLLTPTGRIVIRTPNLDSMLRRRFGPTWWFWQLPYHRVLLGRRGLRLLAAAVDMRVERLKTITDAYTAAASVQLNEIGLAGIVPDGATFEMRIARRGAKWAGWARTLWDRFGRGDEMWAILRLL
ncbi:glycosyltransferase family 9 protein [Humisphaera borealis]|uniref:Methyltransferase domain-containing protein n=1 Tax=Humisphaera borealis TaxID=2807512 RepID=A0A7M2WPY7_9BACT|nr:glycosyltransferase family 9 protein [Humisphaera borealis]QOV87526.1 methyltransferase domain-containing protein [Humisphaera borealis]